MARLLRPRRVKSWPRLFWARAESSYCGNDLECGACGGSGLDGDTAGRPSLCGSCLGSGLVLPLKEPADVEALLGLELAWTAVGNADIAWPQVPFAWLAGPAEVRHVGYARCDGGVIAWVHCGKVLFGLLERTDDAQRRLRRAYQEAFGADARPVKFVLPW